MEEPEREVHYFTGVSGAGRHRFRLDHGAVGRIEAYSGPEGDRTYKYDKTNQLLEVAVPGGSVFESFDFDANGNRDSAGYTTSVGNRMTADGSHKYGYDNEGNTTVTLRLSDNQRTEHTWDHRNRLTRAVVRTGEAERRRGAA